MWFWFLNFLTKVDDFGLLQGWEVQPLQTLCSSTELLTYPAAYTWITPDRSLSSLSCMWLCRPLWFTQTWLPLSNITDVCLLRLPNAQRACSGHSALRNPFRGVWLDLTTHFQRTELGRALPCSGKAVASILEALTETDGPWGRVPYSLAKLAFGKVGVYRLGCELSDVRPCHWVILDVNHPPVKI